jgi:DNA repair exonuclease SbcCD ATPase subunit
MLEQVTIKGFQANRRLVIDFNQPITTIVGPSDVGKTAVLRAIQWLAMNQPAGNDFISWGEDNARVALKVDGHEIVRKIGKSGNLYLLNGEEYRAFGMGKVPQQISDLLCVDEGNFQNQEDTRFWLSETAGSVAKELNAIVNLEAIDAALEKAARELRISRTTEEVAEARLAEARAAAAATEWAIEADSDLKEIEVYEGTIRHNSATIESLATGINLATTLASRQQNATMKASAIGRAVSAGDLAAIADKNASTLAGLLASIKTTNSNAGCGGDSGRIAASITTILQDGQRISQLANSIGSIAKQERAICQAKTSSQNAEKELHQATKGQRCPICGAAM